MRDTELKQYEGTAKQLIEDINQLNKVALGEGAVACQVCGSKLPDGSAVTVFAYRPAGQPTFEVGHVLCGNEHKLPTYFTLGVRELIVDGHIGRCVDPTTQSSWPILLEPLVRAVSTMESTTGQIAPSSSTDSSSEVSWVYGDALLKRATEHDPADGSCPRSGADGAGPVDGECPPSSRDDSVGADSDEETVSADATSAPAASTGPAGGDDDDEVPADAVDGATGPPANDSTVDTDESNGDTNSGEC